MAPITNSLLARVLAVAALATLAGCFDPIVGHPCAPGRTACGELCLDLDNDPGNCGACGNVCLEGVCQAGVCGLSGTGGADGGDPDGLGEGGTSGTSGDAGDSGNGGRDGNADQGDSAGQGGSDGGAGQTGDGSGQGGQSGNAGNAGNDGGAGQGGQAGGSGQGGNAGSGTIDAPIGGQGGSGQGGSGQGGSGQGGSGQGGSGQGGSGALDAPILIDADAGDAGADVPLDVPPVDLGAPDLSPPDVLTCMGTLIPCGAVCLDPDSDPDNCGSCGNRCGSGLCTAGVCQQQGAGHVVLIGHDYVTSRTGMNNLLGNAVFLSSGSPVQVLAFEGDAQLAGVLGANAAISQVAADRGRPWVPTVATASAVQNNLNAYDVLLIYAQHGSGDATLVARGTAWTGALIGFLNLGRTIVLLDGASTNNGGTYQILSAAGLVNVTARTEVTGQTLTLFNPADALALRVPLSYRAEMTSVRFTSTETAKVVTTMAGQPVVIHKTF